MMINSLVRMVTLLFIAGLMPALTTTAQDQAGVPDFTKGAEIPQGAKHDWKPRTDL